MNQIILNVNQQRGSITIEGMAMQGYCFSASAIDASDLLTNEVNAAKHQANYY
jgi:precorrin-6B methylase 2